MQNNDLGSALISPGRPVIAGSHTTLTFTYTAGHPIDDSGYLKIVFRSVSDFGVPQFTNPAAPNYCKVQTDGDCRILPRWDPKGHTRPWSNAIYLQVRGGYLDRGQQITVTFGERSGGSSGWQAQTFCVERFEFKTLVDPIATYQFYELSESPSIQIIPGPAHRAVCTAPSSVPINQSFAYHLNLEDRWGNPLALPNEFQHPGFAIAGIHYFIETDKASGLTVRSNPIEIHEGERPLKPYWGDFHGQSEETIGSGSIERYFTFGRDYAHLEILAHQGNDFQVTDKFWEKINRITADFYQPGKFVTFPGYEYSANTPLGGDRNVYFTSEGGQITRSSCELLPGGVSKSPDSPTAADLFANLRKQNDHHPFVFAHVGGRYADLQTHDPELELAVEVHSAWGTFEWLVEEALTRGFCVGIVANSDGHKCRPGASYPGASTFGAYGGLTCVLAESLDRESVYAALKARHFYGTSGARILADLRLDLGESREALLGDRVEAGKQNPVLRVKLAGTAPIEVVEIRDGIQTIKSLRPYPPTELGSRVKVVWSGAEVRGRDRIAHWDGGLEMEGNQILRAEPINFWNADQPLQVIDDRRLQWISATTGGLSGVILTLKDLDAGTIRISTKQGDFNFKVNEAGFEPLVWSCGGLRKEFRVSRLPDQHESYEFGFALPLENLSAGEHPIFIRAEQEDGHLLWTSPIYLFCK